MRGTITFEIADHIERERALLHLQEIAGSFLVPYNPNIALWYKRISVSVEGAA